VHTAVIGEGLFMALYTGMQAAKAMSAETPKKAFLKGIRPVCRMVRSGRQLQKILYSDRQVLSYQYGHMDPRLIIDYKLRRRIT